METHKNSSSNNNMKFIVALILGAGVTACSSSLTVKLTASQQTVELSSGTDPAMDSLIAPYSRAMHAEFSQVIGQASTELLTNRTSMTLGFWICDKLMQHAREQAIQTGEPLVSIINYGGLRADIPVGDITVGTVYKVMPFDNYISYLKLSADKWTEIEAYMKARGGEPIGGFRIEKGKLVLPEQLKTAPCFWVVTSDFLANGGDKMTFFEKPLERIDTPELFRDFILQTVKKDKTISFSDKERITW